MKQHDLLSRDFEILFVRHAQSHGNVGLAEAAFHPDDPSLTTEGLAQAQALSRRFSAGDLQAIYASTLIRTCQTVEPTAKNLGLPVHVFPDLMEIGTRIPGTELQNVAQLAPSALQSAEKVLPAVRRYTLQNETSAHCVMRAARVIRCITDLSDSGDTVLIASHGSFFGYLIRNVLGLTLPESFGWKVDSCSVTSILVGEREKPLLCCANDVRHFYM